jgi:hypothetical protein
MIEARELVVGDVIVGGHWSGWHEQRRVEAIRERPSLLTHVDYLLFDLVGPTGEQHTIWLDKLALVPIVPR